VVESEIIVQLMFGGVLPACYLGMCQRILFIEV